eukprot:5645461-Pleurochrysis_carterae.AAC.1
MPMRAHTPIVITIAKASKAIWMPVAPSSSSSLLSWVSSGAGEEDGGGGDAVVGAAGEELPLEPTTTRWLSGCTTRLFTET